MMSNKIYLGDGVYADFSSGFDVCLSTNRGERLETIYLEPNMVKILYDYWFDESTNNLTTLDKGE